MDKEDKALQLISQSYFLALAMIILLSIRLTCCFILLHLFGVCMITKYRNYGQTFSTQIILERGLILICQFENYNISNNRGIDYQLKKNCD